MHSDRPILRASVAPWGSGISCIRMKPKNENCKITKRKEKKPKLTFKYDKRSLNEYIANPARLTTQKSTDSTAVGRTPCWDGGGRFRCWSSTAKVTTCRIGLIGKGARDGIVKKWIWWSVEQEKEYEKIWLKRRRIKYQIVLAPSRDWV